MLIYSASVPTETTRIGSFRVSKRDMACNRELVNQLYRECNAILGSETDYVSMHVIVTATSKHFDELGPGEAAPMYQWHLNDKGEWCAIREEEE